MSVHRCPMCEPSDDPRDILLSLCKLHLKQVEDECNTDEWKAKMKAAFEQGIADAERAREFHPTYVPSGLRYR